MDKIDLCGKKRCHMKIMKNDLKCMTKINTIEFNVNILLKCGYTISYKEQTER